MDDLAADCSGCLPSQEWTTGANPLFCDIQEGSICEVDPHVVTRLGNLACEVESQNALTGLEGSISCN